MPAEQGTGSARADQGTGVINASHEAEAFISLLWRHIYTRVRSMLHPHHKEHEPGGKDPLDLPLRHLSDVYLDNPPDDGDALIYEAASSHWINGPGGGGGGAGQAFFEMIPPAVATTPGPTNLTGAALTITRVLIASDGACTGTAAGQSFSFGAGGSGSPDDNTGLTTVWSDGNSISATVATIGGDATYLTVDVYFTG